VELREYLKKIKKLEENDDIEIRVEKIPRRPNICADSLANLGLDV